MSDLVVKADRIFVEGTLARDMILIIRDGRIRSLCNAAQSTTARVDLDMNGCSIVPGFADHHLHFFAASNEKKGGEKSLIEYGILEAWDGGSPDACGFQVRSACSRTLKIRTAGSALYRNGTYGKPVGAGVENIHEALSFIIRMAERCADYIKVIQSGIFEPDTGEISAGGFALQELADIVACANDKGLEVICHANGVKAVRDAVTAGVRGIIHGMNVDDDTLSAMAEEMVFFIPTVNAFRRLENNFATGEARKNIDHAVDSHLSAVFRASERGVAVLAGSDAGASFIPYGISYHEELKLLHAAGLSYDEVYRSAVAGPFTEGGQADFLVLDGLDLKDVFVRGKSVIDSR